MSRKKLLGLSGLALMAFAVISTGAFAQDDQAQFDPSMGGPSQEQMGPPQGPPPQDGRLQDKPSQGSFQQGGRMQGAPGGMMMPSFPTTIVKSTPDGLFVLSGTTLIKYNSTLQKQGSYDLPKATDTKGAPQFADMILATVDGATQVLLVSGDYFINVDAATLAVKATGTLPKLTTTSDTKSTSDSRNTSSRRMSPMMNSRVTMELQGNTLYIQRADQIVAINIKDGKIAGQASLPKPVIPAPADNKTEQSEL